MQQSARRFDNRLLKVVLLSTVFILLDSSALAQESADQGEKSSKVTASSEQIISPAAGKVDIKLVTHDEEIRKRLQSVLDATGWFTEPHVRVEEGVVFLDGLSQSDELKKWAGDLARNNQDVVAVAKRFFREGQALKASDLEEY